MLSQLVETGRRNNVKPDLQELKSQKHLFQIHVKAQIARKIWSNDGFYPIFNETNEILMQAIKLFDRVEELDHTKF
jgi:carboxyl-terminal processing protease